MDAKTKSPRQLAAEIALDFFRCYTGPEKQQIPLQILKALADVTQEQLMAGVVEDEVKFSAKELVEYVETRTEAKVPEEMDKAKASRWLNKHWARLEGLLEDMRPRFEEDANRHGFGILPGINKEESRGGRGLHTYYKLVVMPIDKPLEREPEQALPAGFIRYSLERMRRRTQSPVGWFLVNRPFAETGRRLRSLVAIGGLMLIVLMFFIYIIYIPVIKPGDLLLNDIVLLLASALIVFEMAYPILAVQFRRIIMAPGWAERFTEPEPMQLQVFDVGVNPQNGVAIEEWRLVRYSSVCPICNGRVIVISGGHELKGRLIGSCKQSPREHVWSFDYLTRIGAPLRQTNELLSAYAAHSK